MQKKQKIFERLVVDQLVSFVVPAVKLSDLLADNFGGVLGVELSHSLEVYLLACGGHIK